VYTALLRVVASVSWHKGSTQHTHNRFMAFWILSGTTRYQKKHSPTHTHRGHQSSISAFSIYYDPWHPPYLIHMLYSLFPQSLSKFALVYLLAWHKGSNASLLRKMKGQDTKPVCFSVFYVVTLMMTAKASRQQKPGFLPEQVQEEK